MANGLDVVGEGINCLVIDMEFSQRKWQKAVESVPECNEAGTGWLRLRGESARGDQCRLRDYQNY